jgi:hypothetical protein
MWCYARLCAVANGVDGLGAAGASRGRVGSSASGSGHFRGGDWEMYAREDRGAGSETETGESQLGLDKMLVARWLARFMVSSARLGSARLNFVTS